MHSVGTERQELAGRPGMEGAKSQCPPPKTQISPEPAATLTANLHGSCSASCWLQPRAGNSHSPALAICHLNMSRKPPSNTQKRLAAWTSKSESCPPLPGKSAWKVRQDRNHLRRLRSHLNPNCNLSSNSSLADLIAP